MLHIREAQTLLENLLRDVILQALGERMAAVDSVEALRLVATRAESGSQRNDDDIIPIVEDDAVTASYRWSSGSTADDDGAAVIKPTDVSSGPGRWLMWTSGVRFAPTVGGNSKYLHEIETGPVRRVIVLDRALSDAEEKELLYGITPAVVIEATEDDPEDLDLNVGARWLNNYTFTIQVISQNLRDRREAAQGDEDEIGANAIDGAIRALVAGNALTPAQSEIRAIRSGRAFNSVSASGQRRVIRQRSYIVQVTEENPAAPNDTVSAAEVDLQSEMTDLNDQPAPFDMDNHVITGMAVNFGAGLSKTVSEGIAILDGDEVAYEGELHSFTANTKTFRDLNSDGTMTFVEADLLDADPPVTDGAMRIGVTLTDNDGVVDDRFIAAIRTPYGNPQEIPLT